MKPAEVFDALDQEKQEDTDSQKAVEGGIRTDLPLHTDDAHIEPVVDLVGGTSASTSHTPGTIKRFFDSRVTKLFNVKREGVLSKKTRRTMSAVVSGQAITEPHTEARMLKHQEDVGYSKKSTKLTKGQKKGKGKAPKKSTSALKASDNTSNAATSTRIYNSSSSESDVDDPSELCCVCSRRKPPAGQNIYVLYIYKLVQCVGMRRGMSCKHWVHIPHCSNTKVVRRHSDFFCPCCASPAHHEE